MELSRPFGLYSLCFLVAATTAAQADLTYRFVRDPPSGLPYLIASGSISPTDDMDAFSAAVMANGVHVVTFDSPGGSIDKAIELGRRIRSLDLYTFQTRAAECASACALAFLGGAYRAADPGSIGVHQSYFSPNSALNRDDAVREVQRLTANVSAYIAEMGADPALLELSLRVDRADMRYLTSSEMARFRVTTAIPAEIAAPPAADKQVTLPLGDPAHFDPPSAAPRFARPSSRWPAQGPMPDAWDRADAPRLPAMVPVPLSRRAMRAQTILSDFFKADTP